MRFLLCLFGLHRWRWYSLYDPGELRTTVNVSQCLYCSRLKGGWHGDVNQ